jgi:hypothetical protein
MHASLSIPTTALCWRHAYCVAGFAAVGEGDFFLPEAANHCNISHALAQHGPDESAESGRPRSVLQTTFKMLYTLSPSSVSTRVCVTIT